MINNHLTIDTTTTPTWTVANCTEYKQLNNTKTNLPAKGTSYPATVAITSRVISVHLAASMVHAAAK